MTDYRYAWRNGPRWAFGDFRRHRPVAALRTLWWTLVRGHIGEACQECGRPYLLWHATDDIYGQVTGNWPHSDGEAGGGLFCPACFDRLAEAKGILTIWQPEVYPGTGWSERVAPVPSAQRGTPPDKLRAALKSICNVGDLAAVTVARAADVAEQAAEVVDLLPPVRTGPLP
jgi:hypothetical protein